MVSRRQVLLGGGAVAAVVAVELAVGPGRHAPPHPSPSPEPAGPDPALVAAAADERTLIGAYETATRAHPALAAVLAVPLAHHRAHLAALGGPAPALSAPAPPGARTPDAADRAALRALRAREQTASAARSLAAVDDTRHGALLASIAAAESVHADLLAAAVAARA